MADIDVSFFRKQLFQLGLVKRFEPRRRLDEIIFGAPPFHGGRENNSGLRSVKLPTPLPWDRTLLCRDEAIWREM